MVFLHGIGDSIMFTPALRKYKRKYPGREIQLLVLQLTYPFWKLCPYVTKVHTSKEFQNPPRHGNLLKYIKERIKIQKEINIIKDKEKIDKVEYLVPWSLKVLRISIPIPGIIRRLPLMYKLEPPEVIKLTKRLKVYAGEPAKILKQEIYGTKEKVQLTIPKRKKLCIMHTVGSSTNKSLTREEEEKIIAYLKDNGWNVILLQKVSANKGIISFISKNIAKTVGLITKCDLFIGIDSGPAHIAEALRKPRVVISKAFHTDLLYLKSDKTVLLNKFDFEKVKNMIKRFSTKKDNKPSREIHL